MITATLGETFDARVVGFPPGLTGQVGIRILDHDGNILHARTTTGITEDTGWPTVGSYTVTLPTPAEPTQDGLNDSLLWDWDPTDPPNPDKTATEDLVVQGSLAYQPDTSDVAALIWARTRDGVGVEHGDFTDETRPTWDQATLLIAKATREVATQIGLVIPDRMLESAQNTVALLAASRIEQSFFPEQIQAGRSAYTALYAQYQESMKTLARAVEAADEEDGLLDEFGAAGMPAFSFPPLGPVPHVPGAECPIDTYGLDW